MKQRFLLQKLWIVLLVFLGSTFSNVISQNQVLKHSYTFEEGTYDATYVYDQEGTANGTLGGDKISIADGMCTVSGATANNQGWISLDGTELGLASYSAITLEAFLVAGDAENVNAFTMLAYFGTASPGQGCLWYQPSRRGQEQSRAETNNTTTTITAPLDDVELDDGKIHHLVVVLTGTELSYYLDGALVSQISTADADFISTIGTDVANLFRGVDGWNDPNYNGTLDEFNIYDGAMDLNTIETRWLEYVGDDYVNNNLSALSVTPGDIDIPFDPAELWYEFIVPYGTTEVTVTAKTESDVATYEIYNGSGELIGDDGFVALDENGEEGLEIIVTAMSGATNTYAATIFPYDEKTSERLSDIQITRGELLGEFHPDTTTYTVKADYGVASIDVNAIAMGASATVTGDGEITLVDGKATTVINVLSGDGNATRNYTLNIYTSNFQANTTYYLQHETSGFVLAENDDTYTRIKEAWIDDANQLFQFVPGDIDGQYFVQNQKGNYLRLAQASGNQVWDMVFSPDKHVVIDSCLFEVDEFEQGRYRIVSVARAASFENVYMGTNNNNMNGGVFSDKWVDNQYAVWNIKAPADMELTYNNFLTSLSCDQATLKPGFSAAVMEYYMTVPFGLNSVDIIATPEDANTTVTGAGNVALTEESGDIVITITSTIDASHYKEYVIHYKKDTELTLMHSYTFADGTVRDMVSDAHGVATGGFVDNGVFISGGYFDGVDFVSNAEREEEGFITLPADSIDLTTYPSITIEAYVTAGVNNSWSMLSYFGGLNGSQSFWMSVQNETDYTRSVINQGSEVQSQTVPEASPNSTHHYVTTLTNDSIALFIDGKSVPKAALPDNYLIKNISTENAWIFKGGYPDPNWIGAIYEYNIYSGEMDDITILERSGSLPLEDETTDATLSSLTVDGVAIEGFHPANLNYTVAVEEGATPVIEAVVKIASATYVINAPETIPGQGTVVVTNNGVSATYVIEFEVPTGIGSDVVSATAIKVYPTVSTGEFTVEMEGQSSLITVYDLAGRLVKQVKTNAQREILSLDQKGMYIVKVESDGETQLFKVFKR